MHIVVYFTSSIIIVNFFFCLAFPPPCLFFTFIFISVLFYILFSYNSLMLATRCSFKSVILFCLRKFIIYSLFLIWFGILSFFSLFGWDSSWFFLSFSPMCLNLLSYFYISKCLSEYISFSFECLVKLSFLLILVCVCVWVEGSFIS